MNSLLFIFIANDRPRPAQLEIISEIRHGPCIVQVHTTQVSVWEMAEGKQVTNYGLAVTFSPSSPVVNQVEEPRCAHDYFYWHS